jgi:hypothetical protein
MRITAHGSPFQPCIHARVYITSRQQIVVVQAPICGNTSDRHSGTRVTRLSLGPRMELCVGNWPVAGAPHLNLHTGAVREFHLTITFEFPVHRENMVVKWPFSAILKTRVRVKEKQRQFTSQEVEVHSLCEEDNEHVRSNQFGEIMPHHKLTENDVSLCHEDSMEPRNVNCVYHWLHHA